MWAPGFRSTMTESIDIRIGRVVRERGWRIATAESCTGGLISHIITNMPGCSDYFDRGYVCYSNQAKEDMLGVPASMVAEHGAVSAQVALAMAQGARKRAGVDLAIAVTGIAGPGGGSAAKPVGLVYIAVSGQDGNEVKRFHFDGGRLEIKEKTAAAALEMLEAFCAPVHSD